MAISKRESIIAVIMALSVVIGIYMLFGGGDETGGASAASDLQTLKQQYNEYIKRLEDRERIEEEFEKIENMFPKRSQNKNPEAAFTEDVVKLCGELGIQVPKVSPVSKHEIEGVDNYLEMNLRVEIRGITIENASYLIQGFSASNIIINELGISKLKIDAEDLVLIVEVARIVRADEIDTEDFFRSRDPEGPGAGSGRRGFAPAF